MDVKLEPSRHSAPRGKRPQLWLTGAFLIFGGFVAGLVRPEATSQAQAVGRAAGQIILMATGVGMVVVDLIVSRSRRKEGDDGR